MSGGDGRADERRVETPERLRGVDGQGSDDSYRWDTDELRRVVSGEYTPPVRGFLYREDDQGLLYEGQIHAIVAAPEGAKTLLAYFALSAADDIPVVLIDFEMGPVQAGERLNLLGAAVGENWHYKYRPDMVDVIAAVPPGALVVIDATDGGFAALDLNPDKTGDANKYEAIVTAPLKAKGCTVVLLDHSSTAHNVAGRKRGAMGNTKKLGNVDTSLYMKVEQPGSPHHVGLYQLWVDKDRSAQLRGIAHRNDGDDHLATMRTENVDGILTVQMLTPRPWRPTQLMEQVSVFLETVTEAQSKKKIETDVEGKNPTIRLAVDLLVTDGYVDRKRGPHNAQLHTSVKPYRQTSDPRISPENTTSSHLVPVRPGRGQTEGLPTSSPPSQGGRGEDPNEEVERQRNPPPRPDADEQNGAVCSACGKEATPGMIGGIKYCEKHLPTTRKQQMTA
jgi:hypothetical protein